MYQCSICGKLMESVIHEMFHKALAHYPAQTAIVTLIGLGLILAASSKK